MKYICVVCHEPYEPIGEDPTCPECIRKQLDEYRHSSNFRARMYAIQATITRDNAPIQLPTFYLNTNVQGIISEKHAVEIVIHMITQINPMVDYNVSAVCVGEWTPA